MSGSKEGMLPHPDLAPTPPHPWAMLGICPEAVVRGKPMLWEQLLALASVAPTQRQNQGGWLGLGIFFCPEGKGNQLLGRALRGLWLVEQAVCRSEMQVDKGFGFVPKFPSSSALKVCL